MPHTSSSYLLYIGSYTDKSSTGITLLELAPEAGTYRMIASYDGITNASFMHFSADRRFGYAVGETMQYKGQEGGSIISFAVHPETGELARLNELPTYGGLPCHIGSDREGKILLIPNYMGQNVCLAAVDEDSGELKSTKVAAVHKGSGPNGDRQECSHPHSVRVDKDGRYAYVADLGTDQIIAYEIDYASLQLLPRIAFQCPSGAGPRHLVFHPQGKFLYAINELDSTILAISINSDGENGEQGSLEMSQFQVISTLPEGFQEESYCAEIAVSPDGRFLYGSNRGHNSIAIYAIHQETGLLTLLEHTHTGGNWPRNFSLTPEGAYLIVANQLSDTIAVFQRDIETGLLHDTGMHIQVSQPAYVKALIR